MAEIVITREELFQLLEYSCSLPTATTIGKQWRRDVHAYQLNPIPLDQHEWKIGEYVPHSNPEYVGIKWAWAVDKNHEPHRGKYKRN